MNDEFAAVLLLAFVAIAWTLLAAVVQNASANTKEGQPLNALSPMAVAGAFLALVLFLLAATGGMEGIVDALRKAV
jgi:hypothetical protein